MKKIILVILVILLCIVSFPACKNTGLKDSEQNKEYAENQMNITQIEALPKIRVAVMPYILSASIAYAKEQKWDIEAGINMEFVMYPQGAAINSGLSNGEWDVAVTGGAAIFGVAEYNAKYICDYQDGTGGNEIHVRPNSDVTEAKGFNPTFPENYGDPESVSGKTVLFCEGTTSQMQIVMYLESLGLSDSDVNMVSMPLSEIWPAFSEGEGDIVSMPSPYTGLSKYEGNLEAATLTTLGSKLYECCICSSEAYDYKKDELAAFISVLLRANEAFENDPNLKFEQVRKWYYKNGTELNDKQIQIECSLKRFITRDDIKLINYGEFQENYAEFLASVGKLEVKSIDTVIENTKPDILEEAIQMMQALNY